jgi:hypothetical protein
VVGYPNGLYEAVSGFNTFDEAEDFAKQTNGKVMLLARRDGHEYWSNQGRIYKPIELDDQFVGNEEEVFENRHADMWFSDFLDTLTGRIEDFRYHQKILSKRIEDRNCLTPEKFAELGRRCAIVYEAISEADDEEVVVVNNFVLWDKLDYPVMNYDLYRVGQKYNMHLHDDDVMDYMIAVVPGETEEDED